MWFGAWGGVWLERSSTSPLFINFLKFLMNFGRKFEESLAGGSDLVISSFLRISSQTGELFLPWFLRIFFFFYHFFFTASLWSVVVEIRTSRVLWFDFQCVITSTVGWFELELSCRRLKNLCFLVFRLLISFFADKFGISERIFFFFFFKLQRPSNSLLHQLASRVLFGCDVLSCNVIELWFPFPISRVLPLFLFNFQDLVCHGSVNSASYTHCVKNTFLFCV